MTLKVDGTNGVLQAYDYQVPTTGFSYTFAAGTTVLVMNPAGTLATGTITMPAAPADGMVITVTSTQPITALTVNANTGQTINNGGTLGLQAGGTLAYMYNLANTKWQPFDAGLPLGVGQTWQNVTSSRAIGTTYTNSTGRPIMVIVSGTGGGANGLWGVTLNSAISYYTPSTYTASVWTACEFIVPAGNTYQLSQQGSSVTLQNWSELR